MYKKLWLLLILSFLFLNPASVPAQNEQDIDPKQELTEATPSKWSVFLSSPIINSLSSPKWKDKEAQIVSDIIKFNPSLSKVMLAQEDRYILMSLFRETGEGKEKLIIKTSPEVLLGRKSGAPLHNLEIRSWLDNNDSVSGVELEQIDNQNVWKISAKGSLISKEETLIPPEPKINPNPLETAASDSYLVDAYVKGGFCMHLILLCSIGGVYIIIDRLFALRRKNIMPHEFLRGVFTKLPDRNLTPKERSEKIDELINYCSGSYYPIANSLKSGLYAFHDGIGAVKQAVFDSNLHEGVDMAKGLSILEVLSNLAPLLGLLGTVTGMIRAFNAVSLYGTGRPEVVASGVSEALITTAYGLLVGIPLLLIYHFLESRIESLQIEMEDFSVDIAERLLNVKKEQREIKKEFLLAAEEA